MAAVRMLWCDNSIHQITTLHSTHRTAAVSGYFLHFNSPLKIKFNLYTEGHGRKTKLSFSRQRKISCRWWMWRKDLICVFLNIYNMIYPRPSVRVRLVDGGWWLTGNWVMVVGRYGRLCRMIPQYQSGPGALTQPAVNENIQGNHRTWNRDWRLDQWRNFISRV